MDIPSKKSTHHKQIFYLSPVFKDGIDPELYKLIAMVNISRILDSDNIPVIVGGILSLYALMNETVLEVEDCQKTLLEEGFKLVKLNVRSKQDVAESIHYTDKDSNEMFLQYLQLTSDFNNSKAQLKMKSMSLVLRDRFKSLNFPMPLILAYSGMCLSLICKSLNKFNYFSWVKNRWKSFLGTVGLNHEHSHYGPCKLVIPRLKVCKDVYKFFYTHHTLRRRLYVGIMKLSSESGLWSNVCRTLLRFSKGLEMNHICLINTYILQDHPELINVEELKPEFSKLQIAFQVFQSVNIPEEQWPYLKIMSTALESVLNKNNFPILNYIAVQIGKQTRPSLSEYHCAIPKEMMCMADKILEDMFVNSATQITKIGKDKSVYENLGTSPEHELIVDRAEFTNLLSISNILENSLHRLLGVNSFDDRDKFFKCISNPIPSTKVWYFEFQKEISFELIEISYMLNIARVCESQNTEEIIGGIMTFFTIFDPEFVRSDECRLSFINCGLELCGILVESSKDVISYFKFEDEELNLLFMRYLGEESLKFDHIPIIIKNPAACNLFKKIFLKIEKPQFFSYIGIYLILIFKRLHDEKHFEWLYHKWITFNRVLKIYDYINLEHFLSLLIPTTSTCSVIHSFFSSNFQLRKILFVKIIELSDRPHFLSPLFLVVGQLAKETEVNHIFLINNFIFYLNNTLLKMKELKPELLRFVYVFKEIGKKMLPVEQWPYIKILLHPTETEFLNKHNFPLLTYIAEYFHSKVQKSSNYSGAEEVTPFFTKVAETADKFIELYCETPDTEWHAFEVNFLSGNLLSTLGDEELRNLMTDSKTMSQCLNSPLGRVPKETETAVAAKPEFIGRQFYVKY